VTWSAAGTFGSAGALPNQFANPTGVALSGDGLTAWIADNGNTRIDVWVRPSSASSSWALATTFGTAGTGLDQFRAPSGVAVSRDLLTVWASDLMNNRVSVWNRAATTDPWTFQVNITDVEPVERPETVYWVGPTHKQP